MFCEYRFLLLICTPLNTIQLRRLEPEITPQLIWTPAMFKLHDVVGPAKESLPSWQRWTMPTCVTSPDVLKEIHSCVYCGHQVQAFCLDIFFPIQLYLAYRPSLSLNLSRLCFFFIETDDSILSSSVLLQSSPSVNGHVFIFIFFSSDLIASNYFCSIYRRNYKLRLCYTDVY